MPWGLKRFQQTGDLHFLTISCYRRLPRFDSAQARSCFETALDGARQWYGFTVIAYVVMPEHVHLLISEPKRASLATVLQMLKQTISKRMRRMGCESPLWQSRYFDENVHLARQRVTVMKYIHRNPVKRNLCAKPEDWDWSSFRHYATGVQGVVEIESEWTARRRERMESAFQL
jgi:putative transposase